MEPLEQLLAGLRRGFAQRPVSDAVKEGVAPLLHYALEKNAQSSSLALRRAYYETGAHNINRLSTLEALRQRCVPLVPIIPIKGIDLATRVYPTIATRPMTDIDVWVPRVSIPEAERALAALGYRPAMPEMSKRLTRLVKHARLYVGGPADSVGVDLHWSLVVNENDRRAPSLAWFRERSRSSSSLTSTAHLLYLAAHMKLQHYDDVLPLIWLVDFYLLAHAPDLDWSELHEAAASFGWSEALASVRYETERRLELPLPSELGPAIRTGPIPVKDPAAYAWKQIANLGFWGRVLLIKAWLLPDPSYVRWRYRPARRWAWPLYYPVRWTESALSGLRLFWRRLRGETSSPRALVKSHPIA